MTCLGYGFVNWWFWMIVSNNPQITQKCFGLRTYLETICKDFVNLRLHHPQGLFTWECKRCQWLWLVIYVGLSMGAPVNFRFTALLYHVLSIKGGIWGPVSIVMISKPTTFQRHGNGLSHVLCQVHKKDQKGVPSGKLTIRPWQSSGLVQISETIKTRLWIQGPTVNSPPARWGLLDFMSVACSSSPLLSSSSPLLLLVVLLVLLVQLRPAIHSVLCRTSTTTIHAQCSLPDLNREYPCQVFPAGPQPWPSTPSVPCRTSTTSIHAQCSLPDINHDHPRPVFPAGPQPRVSMPSVPCRTSCRKIWDKVCAEES